MDSPSPSRADSDVLIPLINISEDLELSLEWFNKYKKLTIFYKKGLVEYLKSWGSDIDNEMEDGVINCDEDLNLLFNWLFYNE